MGLFDRSGDAFRVDVEGVTLEYPDQVEIGEDFTVTAEIRTNGGSDDYYFEDVQLYLEDGPQLCSDASFDNPIGGAVDRWIPFNLHVDGEQTEELYENDYIETGESYALTSFVLFPEAFNGGGLLSFGDDEDGIDQYRSAPMEGGIQFTGK